MSLAITSALASASVTATNPPSTTASQQPIQQQAQQPTNNSTHTVTLTEAQQVYNLYNQGQTVPQISTSLSLPVSMVNNYLGITESSG
jgi:DNA-binding NarL/FixJ family response regulator